MMRVLGVVLLPRVGPDMLFYERAMRSIFAQDWDGTLEFYVQSGDDGGGTALDRVAYKYEQARHIALSCGFDAMWCAEYDMIMPPDALRVLSTVDAEVAYGLYCWRYPPYHWNSYVYLDWQGGVSLSELPAIARQKWGQRVVVKGLGQGCTLFRREVLQRISFQRRGHASCDWYAALDTAGCGMIQVCDTSVVCGHMSNVPRPSVVWPDPQSLHLFRMEYND